MRNLGMIGLAWVLAAVLVVPAWPAAGQPWSPGSNPSFYQLLTNPGVEIYDSPYAQFQGVNCQVASAWQRFWYGGPEPYWMDTRVFASSHLGTGWVERIEGETSHLILATEPYTAGIQQQVAGLTPGVGYGFHAAMLTVFETSAQPAEHDTMFKQVGMDPTGGTDPQAPTVIWSEPDGLDQGPWRIDLRTAAWAEAPTMTVFIRVASLYPSGDPSLLNLSFLDSAILAQTPAITATSLATTDVPTFTVTWADIVPPPGGGQMKWRDVQWLDEAEGLWHDWITETYALQASFTGERGHVYHFRARQWHRYPNGAHLYSPYRPAGDTQTAVQGASLVGRVLTYDGTAVCGVRVALAGQPGAAISGSGGWYELPVPLTGETQTITVSHSLWPSPSPLYSVTLGLTETLPFTWTLRPADDVVTNGEFEAGLDGWQALGVLPLPVAQPVHTGRGAAVLNGPAGVTFTTGISQNVVLAGAWEPALSFWYWPEQVSAGDRLNVSLTVVTHTVSPTLPVTWTALYTPALDAAGWHHAVYPAGPEDQALTGTATIRFQLWHASYTGSLTTTLYLDEVALGATPGRPNRVYLPLVPRRRS